MSDFRAVEMAPVDHDPFADAPLASVVPTTEPQREIWLASMLGNEASLAYNESVSLHLRGPLDTSALRAALQDMVDRHDALRGTISDDGQLLYLADSLVLAVAQADVSSLTDEGRVSALAQARRRAVETPFDLEHGPLLRAELLKLAAAEHVLVLTAHHIVCDGWSFGVLVTELSTLYAQRSGGGPSPDPADTYATYAVSQTDAEHQVTLEADTAYWVSVYDGSVPVLELPADRPRKPVRGFASRRVDTPLDATLVAAVRKLGATEGASLFATMFGVFSALLARLSGNGDVVVGVAAAGQSAAGAMSLVGHCVNLLPIRMAVDLEQDVSTLLRTANTRVLDAYDHQHCTFGTLLKKLQVVRDPGRLPLVSALFNLDANIDNDALSVGDLHVELTSNPRHFENFDLYLNATQAAGSVVLECQYNTDLFDASTIERWLALYRTALERAVAEPAAPLAHLLAPTQAEQALLAAFNRTDSPYENTLRLSDLVLRAFDAHPDAAAVAFEGREVSYRALEAQAWGIAAALRAQGAGPGTLVGVCLERSVEMVASLLGVLFSGAAYVPLDPTLPAARLVNMREDAGLRLILSRPAELAKTGDAFAVGCEVLRVDTIEPGPRLPLLGIIDDLAYVIFTSGSTGRPKGAANAHRGIVNRLQWMQEAYALQPDDRVLQKTPFTFDVSVWEFFWPLCTGATLVVARPEGHRDAEYLVDLIQRERITLMHFVPSMLVFFLAKPHVSACRTVRRVLCSGEALPYDLVEQFFDRLPSVALGNLYGPTEAAVDVTAWECVPHDPSGLVPIGTPIANTVMYVLDSQFRPLPLGVPGDLYIGGVQVGLGYVGRPELTAERFLVDPFRAGGRMYKTGDIAKWRPDGAIVYLGRADFQVKLRGYRIELGEIEAALQRHPDIGRAVVVTREDEPGDLRLVAYAVSNGPALAADALRNFLRLTLPDYMVPQQIVQLESIPLLTSGKVDGKGLPRPAVSAPVGGAPRVAASTQLEQQVLSAMEQILNLPGLGMRDDFFALGGHSLLAAKLTARLNKELGTSLPLRTVFEVPTAEGLARAAQAALAGDTPKRVPVEHRPERREAPLTLMQERIRFMEELHPGRVVYNTPSAHRLTGPMQRDAFETALRAMLQRQPGLRTAIVRGANGPVQRVVDDIDFRLPFEDLSGVPDAEREAELMRRLHAVIAQPIDIYRAPLFRTAMYRLSEEQHVFLFMPHHIVWDGWSFDLLYQELAALYPAALEQRPVNLPAPAVSYLDYAHWHARWMAGDECRAQVQFWKQRYARVDTLRTLPTDRPRRAGMSGAGEVEWIHIDKAFTERLRDVARQFDATLNMLIMAVYAVQISQALASRTLVLGVPVRGRLNSEVESVMGFFNNLLPTPLDVDSGLSVKAWVASVKRGLLDSFANQDVPFERLATEPEIALHANKAGLYQSLFSWQDARDRDRRWGPLQHQSVLVMQKGATEDFGLWLMEVPGGLEGGINYNADLFDGSTARAFRERLIGLLRRVAEQPGLTVTELLAEPGDDTRAFDAWVHTRHALAPAVVAVVSTANRGAPTGAATIDPDESRLADIWARLLGVDAALITAHDNFFDIGGSSLLVMQAVSAAEKELGLKVDPGRYVYESLGKLAHAGGTHAGVGRVWAQLLGIDPAQVQPGDNFFDLGGNSLLVMQAVSEAQKQLGLKIDPNRFVYENLRQLSVVAAVTTSDAAPAQPQAAVEPTGLLGRVLGRFGRRA